MVTNHNYRVERFEYSPISNDKELRIIDLRFDKDTVTRGYEFEVTAVLSNSGSTQKSVTLNPENNRGRMEVEPTAFSVDLDPGERQRITFNVRLLDTGTQTLNIEGAKHFMEVKSVSDATGGGIILDRNQPKETFQHVSQFKDGDGTQEPYETDDIPPYERQEYRYKDTSSGDMSHFGNIVSNSSSEARIDGSPNIGVSFNHVPDNNVYTFDIKYTTSDDTLEIEPQYPEGKEIHDGTNYVLHHEQRSNHIKYQLSPKEQEELQEQNELYTVLSNQFGVDMQIEQFALRSTRDIMDLTNSSLEVQIFKTEKTTYKTGEHMKFTAAIHNDGDASDPKVLKLVRNGVPVNQKEVMVNPGSTKTIVFHHYEYNPGTHRYWIQDSERKDIQVNER